MTLDYIEGSTDKFSMIYYIDEIISTFNKAKPIGRGIKAKTAPEDLYKVDEYCEKLSPDEVKMFHNIVAKTLYTTKRASPDNCTEVAFLTTRVIEPKKYDWGELVHLMKYIRGTTDLPLILSTNVSGVIKWCIDESY